MGQAKPSIYYVVAVLVTTLSIGSHDDLRKFKCVGPHVKFFRRSPWSSLGDEVANDDLIEVPRLVSSNLIENVLPLHNAEFLKHFQHRWVLSAGGQPVEDIRDYFGTEIAMYFSWLGHLTIALWFPAVLGLVVYFVVGFNNKTKPDNEMTNDSFQVFSDVCFVCFAFFNCVWSTVYSESWKRKQAELAFRWGTYDNNCDSYLQDPRPQFRGDCFAPNPVPGRMEPFYPAWKHAIIRYGITYPLSFLCVVCMFIAMLVMFQMQDMADL